MSKSYKLAKVVKMKGISVIWIIPIITIFIGIWIIYFHFADRGTEFTLISKDASGIVAGKTVIKNRSVDVGIIDEVTLDQKFQHVVIKGRIYKGMEPLLKNDSIFWIVKPQIGRDGITGLGTILSGNYIEIVGGRDSKYTTNKSFNLSDTPPLTDPSIQGLRLNLESEGSGVIPRGAAILFRGFHVGNVESSTFDIKTHSMKYQVFISKPYDSLVSQNVRFWKEGGVNFSFSPQGASLDIPSLDVLLSGGISFDFVEGSKAGEPVKQDSTFKLYKNKNETLESQFTEYNNFLLMFPDSISGLVAGAAVEYRGIRLGTVSEVPFYTTEILKDMSILSREIPVLIRIEPGRLSKFVNKKVDIVNELIKEQKNGLRATLKTSNLLTGQLYIDLDFYPESVNHTNHSQHPSKLYGFDTIETESTGFAQMQSKVIDILDTVNSLPLKQTFSEFNKSLEKTDKLLGSTNNIMSSKEMQTMPKEVKKMLISLNQTLKSFEPGSELNLQMKESLQKVQQLMDELTPLVNTLNDKSNALIFSAPVKKDIEPKAKGNR